MVGNGPVNVQKGLVEAFFPNPPLGLFEVLAIKPFPKTFLSPPFSDQVWGLGFGVWGLGFGVWGLGFGVWEIGRAHV